MQNRLKIAPITFDLFEKLCLILGLDPDEVLFSDTPAPYTLPDDVGPLIGLLAASPIGPDVRKQFAVLVPNTVQHVFAEISQHVARAMRRVQHYKVRYALDACEFNDGKTVEIERILVALGPAAYRTLRQDMSLEDCLAYLFNQATFTIAADPDAHIKKPVVG